MLKRAIIFALSTLLLTLWGFAEAQQPGKVWRVGYLDPSSASTTAEFLEAFRREMTKLGWIEGKNIVIEYRFAELKSAGMPELASELVR